MDNNNNKTMTTNKLNLNFDDQFYDECIMLYKNVVEPFQKGSGKYYDYTILKNSNIINFTKFIMDLHTVQ
jgi:hypothetical protein